MLNVLQMLSSQGWPENGHRVAQCQLIQNARLFRRLVADAGDVRLTNHFSWADVCREGDTRFDFRHEHLRNGRGGTILSGNIVIGGLSNLALHQITLPWGTRALRALGERCRDHLD